jgi:iron complex outermembrane receptor protein
VLVQALGEVDSESLQAYEAGWKQRVTPTLGFDLAAYYNDYEDLRAARVESLTCQPSGLPVISGCFLFPRQTHVVQVAPTGNWAKGHSYGFELAADWRPMRSLVLQGSWSNSRMIIEEEGSAFSTDREGSAPDNQFALRIGWNPRTDTDLDLWLRRVGTLSDLGQGTASVPAYTELDLRLAWRPTKEIELALVGRNLLHEQHREFASELRDVPVMQVERSVFGQINWKF